MQSFIVISVRKTYHIRLHVQYSLPDDEHKMLETCKKTKRTELKHCFGKCILLVNIIPSFSFAPSEVHIQGVSKRDLQL
jgi:hypothetical protein